MSEQPPNTGNSNQDGEQIGTAHDALSQAFGDEWDAHHEKLKAFDPEPTQTQENSANKGGEDDNAKYFEGQHPGFADSLKAAGGDAYEKYVAIERQYAAGRPGQAAETSAANTANDAARSRRPSIYPAPRGEFKSVIEAGQDANRRIVEQSRANKQQASNGTDVKQEGTAKLDAYMKSLEEERKADADFQKIVDDNIDGLHRFRPDRPNHVLPVGQDANRWMFGQNRASAQNKRPQTPNLRIEANGTDAEQREALAKAHAEIRDLIRESTDPAGNETGILADPIMKRIREMLGKEGRDPANPLGDANVGDVMIILVRRGDREGAQGLGTDYVREMGATLGDDKSQELRDLIRRMNSQEEPSYKVTDEAVRMNEEFDAGHDKAIKAFEEARDKYVAVSAEQRGSHLGALAGPPKGKFRKLMHKIGQGLRLLDNPKTQKIEAERAAAKLEYVTAARNLGQFKARFNGERTVEGEQFKGEEKKAGEQKAILFQLQAMDATEPAILAAQVDNAIKHSKPGEGMSLRDKFNARRARNWLKSGRVGKVFRVGVPAAVVGASITMLAPPFAPLVAGIAGRTLGQKYAQNVNRHAVLTPSEYKRLETAAKERDAAFKRSVDTINDNPNLLDISKPIEEGTIGEYTRNYSRHAKAGTVGAVAANAYRGVELGVKEGTKVVHHFTNHGNGTGQQPPPPKNPDNGGGGGDGGAPSGNASKGAGIPTNTAPWETAHLDKGLVPQGHEMDAVRQEIKFFNQSHPNAHLGLGTNSNGYEALENKLTGAAQTPGSQASFNRDMIEDIASGKIKF
jgi:hypothetical protein